MVIVGIDEVGRGCLAGPLVAGAVVLNKNINGLKDSKKLSRLQRNNLTKLIYANAEKVGLGWVTPTELDKYGLTRAVRLAMQRALLEISVAYNEIIIDGNYNFLADIPETKTIIRADSSIPSVSAASIVAKVARDNWMINIAANQLPVYCFEKHVGYATNLHLAMLKIHGVSRIHRLSYKPVKEYL